MPHFVIAPRQPGLLSRVDSCPWLERGRMARLRRLRPFAGSLSIDVEAAEGDGCTHERGDGRRAFRTVLLFVLLWSSIPLVVKAQTACLNCYNAFACPQKYKECTNSCKVYPFGDDRRI